MRERAENVGAALRGAQGSLQRMSILQEPLQVFDLLLQTRDHTIEASAGTSVFVPIGVAHTYYEAVGPTRYLIIMTSRLRELITALQHH